MKKIRIVQLKYLSKGYLRRIAFRALITNFCINFRRAYLTYSAQLHENILKNMNSLRLVRFLSDKTNFTFAPIGIEAEYYHSNSLIFYQRVFHFV